MTYELPQLPYADDALEPYISRETISYHYGKHHLAYVNNLNKLVPDSEFSGFGLDELVLKSTGAIFNNAAQVWNHSFYWSCLSPAESTQLSGDLEARLIDAFGSVDAFKAKFTEAGMKRFGSGWAWLVQNADGQLEIMSTANADNPLTQGYHPLLTCDVWEHAYYVDTRNNRGKYIENFWNLVNWDFVAAQMN
jgi:superoxide dismutase, Fe-Mn family